MKNLITYFWNRHTSITHWIAGAFLSLMSAYAAVPQFHAFVVLVYSSLPKTIGEAIIAGIALVAWYHHSGNTDLRGN